MINYQVYFPQDLLRQTHKLPLLYLLGYWIDLQVAIVVTVTSNHAVLQNWDQLPLSLRNFTVVGTVHSQPYKNNATEPLQFSDLESYSDGLSVRPLSFYYGLSLRYPVLEDSENSCSFILFNPPNARNLEYFSIDPILLQHTNREPQSYNRSLNEKLMTYDPETNRNSSNYKSNCGTSISDEAVLDQMNKVRSTRNKYREWLKELNLINPQSSSSKKYVALMRLMVVKAICQIILWIQMACIVGIKIINVKVGRLSLVDCFLVMKQLDLRLKQINYFPIQFMYYYDHRHSQISLQILNVPKFNTSLNVNNSNYINLYNSVWLIANDMIFGITCYRLLMVHFSRIAAFVSGTLIQDILYVRLYSLTRWVSYNHPAGFKLNNELGNFMGDLYLWTINFWNAILEQMLRGIAWWPITMCLQAMLQVVCLMGMSFLISAIVDVLKFTTFHIYCFYYSSSKIYNKQIDVIRSLFQLFRGKKYNVLRRRIDHIDMDGDRFEIDRLLLGTLLFMVAIFLLPTVFAFYLMYFLLHLALQTLVIVLEWAVIFGNFFPLFVLLLKWKNSSRLQGGITFKFVDTVRRTTYLTVANQSLSYQEIFQRFGELIRYSKHLNAPLLASFFAGNPLSYVVDDEIRFNYLMLPNSYDKTPHLWKLITKPGSTKGAQ